MKKPGLYVHVPFCGKKCPYCDFYSVPYRKNGAESYCRGVLQEMEAFRDRSLSADTLYFGGGTPSLLSGEQIGAVISHAKALFSLDPAAEITLEANPNTLSRARLEDYHARGVNRLSLGMQSAQPEELSLLGRTHTFPQVEQAVELSRQAGIINLSLDIMLGIPGQTRETALDTLRRAAFLPVEHISAYLLKVEPATPYWNSPLRNQCMEEDALADLYLETVDFLETAGFFQYEISNFARPGKESRHNLKYWRCEEYLGFGPGAHSFFEGRRYENPRDLAGYIAAPGESARDYGEPGGGIEEQILLRMRLREGIPLGLLKELPQKEEAAFLKTADRFAAAGYLQKQGDRLCMTPGGFLVSNTILSRLLEFVPSPQKPQ